MFGLFKKNKVEEIASPFNGEVIQITEVEDPVFSEKMMGDGIAIIPSEGKLYSPVNGEVIQVFETKHAMIVKSNEGTNILMHVGLETVELGGVPFEPVVKAGDKIEKGQLLMNIDLEYIKNNNLPIVTPVVLVNDGGENEKEIAEKVNNGKISANQMVFKIK